MANDVVFYRPKSSCFLPSFSLAISSQFGSNDPLHHREMRRYTPHFASAPTTPPIDFMKTIDLRSDNDSDYKFQYTVANSQEKAEDLQKENVELDRIVEDNEDFDESFGRGAETKLCRRRWAGIVVRMLTVLQGLPFLYLSSAFLCLSYTEASPTMEEDLTC
ncbi:hypothetical protein BDQ12DRAFT_250947 [Crucibulum laeve]|uniref:Uncharacterized protein n=1 Tax=Crucibulum laeve TaxID=68775 RepID=A0A5C3LTH5_9AGAR|nr:hypothetical protein BDQ12DRAFT_250947 [Crucibulum laeve]